MTSRSYLSPLKHIYYSECLRYELRLNCLEGSEWISTTLFMYLLLEYQLCHALLGVSYYRTLTHGMCALACLYLAVLSRAPQLPVKYSRPINLQVSLRNKKTHCYVGSSDLAEETSTASHLRIVVLALFGKASKGRIVPECCKLILLCVGMLREAEQVQFMTGVTNCTARSVAR